MNLVLRLAVRGLSTARQRNHSPSLDIRFVPHALQSVDALTAPLVEWSSIQRHSNSHDNHPNKSDDCAEHLLDIDEGTSGTVAKSDSASSVGEGVDANWPSHQGWRSVIVRVSV